MSGVYNISKLFESGQSFEFSINSLCKTYRDTGIHLNGASIQVDGLSTVIDNIAVYGSTIIIVEAKNYTELYGTSEDYYWKGKGRGRYFSVNNPIEQNSYHSKVFCNFMLSVGLMPMDYNFECYVVVPDDCLLEVDEESRKRILTLSQLNSLQFNKSLENPKPDSALSNLIRGSLM